MHHLLERLLKKYKVSSIQELSADDQSEVRRWQTIFSQDEITVADIQTFCSNQVLEVEKQWRDTNNSSQKNDRLIILHTVYRSLIDLIQAPKTGKAQLEAYLQNLLDQE